MPKNPQTAPRVFPEQAPKLHDALGLPVSTRESLLAVRITDALEREQLDLLSSPARKIWDTIANVIRRERFAHNEPIDQPVGGVARLTH